MISEREEWLKALRAVPIVARAVAAGLSNEEARRRPGEGEWSVVEIVAHMADTDEHALARIERMLGEEVPDLPAFDQAQLAIDAGYRARSIDAELTRLADVDARLLARLETMDDAGWARAGRHAEHGLMTVETYLAHVAGEDVDHLAQMARARAGSPN